MNKEIIGKIFPDELKAISLNKCPICGNNINKEDFKDGLSLKEFEISGMCQNCQNKVFR